MLRFHFQHNLSPQACVRVAVHVPVPLDMNVAIFRNILPYGPGAIYLPSSNHGIRPFLFIFGQSTKKYLWVGTDAFDPLTI